MSREETQNVDSEGGTPGEGGDVRDRLEREADRAIEQFDESIVELLSWVLDTETRARIYVYLRKHPESTSDEVAAGTGLYPSTVREALAELHGEEKVTREKRESSGAGNNPYEYSAMAPSDLVGEVVEDIQSELNTVFNLDRVLGGADTTADEEPVTITVEEETTAGPDVGGDSPDGSDDVVDGDESTIEASDGDAGDSEARDDETGDEEESS